MPDRFTGREDALGWLDAERASLVAAVTMAAAFGRDQVAMRLPLILAEYLDWRRRFDDWIAVTTVSLNAARRLSDRARGGDAHYPRPRPAAGAPVRRRHHRPPGRRRQSTA